MPYPNMPKSKWPAMERCVAKVKAQGKVKNAYAVCYDSIMGKKKKKAGSRRLGHPRTEAERRKRHQRLYGTSKLPRRGTGLKKKTKAYITERLLKG